MTAPQSVLRRYTAHFHPRSGELFVYGSFSCGALSLFLFFNSGNLVFLPFFSACLFMTFYFQPFLDTENAQIGADTTGIYVRKLGHIPWSTIEAFRVQRIAVRSVERASLQIKLRDNWQNHINCVNPFPAYDRFTYKIWKKKNNNIIEIRLEHMKEDTRIIENSITEIWQNRPVSQKAP